MICIDCITPKTLKKLVLEHGAKHTCQYCGNERIAAAPDYLFDYILERTVENTATEEDLSQYEYAMLFDCGSDEISVASLDVVLSEWIDLCDEPYYVDLYEHAPKELKINARGMDRLYFADDGLLERNFYEDKWERFTDEARHSHRFFNPIAKEFLDSVFTFLSDDNDELKNQCIRKIDRGVPFYRARSASTYEDVKKIADAPASQLGPTPKDRASSQRMTPSGISALYCSFERETCLSEIRSITGDYVVSIAMTPTSQLLFLDLTKLELVEPPKLTLLDKGYRDVLHLKSFVSSLVKKLSKPKGRNDELSYLSTQIVFEHLRFRFGDQVNGLIFPSVQTGEHGINLVLFPEYSVVSAKNYRSSSASKIRRIAKLDSEPEEKEPYEAAAKVYCVSGSLRFHRVKAIETKAVEYSHISELCMSDLNRKRLGVL